MVSETVISLDIVKLHILMFKSSVRPSIRAFPTIHIVSPIPRPPLACLPWR